MTNVSNKMNNYFKAHYPALWLAINHHRTHKNHRITFENYEYLKGPFLDNSRRICLKKSTQNGFTEWLTVQALSKALIGRQVFHVMPTGSLKDRYVKNRLDRSIQFTPYYQEIFRQEEKKKAWGKFSESMSLKHFGDGTIAFVGSNSPASFTEFPADDIIIDELDQCDQKNILMAKERLSNSADPREIYISNPTIDGFGIDEVFADSDQKRWHIKCDHCGHWFHISWFETIVRKEGDDEFSIRDPEWKPFGEHEARVMCPKCAKPNDRYKAGEWVIQREQANISGYHVSKLFSSKTTINDLILNFEKALDNESRMERFYNADLGESYISDGAKITDKHLNEAVGKHRHRSELQGVPVMGVDVGSVCNYIIGYVQPSGAILVGDVGILKTEAEEISRKMYENKVQVCVIDSRPEASLVRKLKEMHHYVFANEYKEHSLTESVDVYRNVKIDRTTSLDAVKEGLITGRLVLPIDARNIPDFYDQLKASTRILDPDAHRGQGTYRWVEGSKADHFHHALNYMNIASRILTIL